MLVSSLLSGFQIHRLQGRVPQALRGRDEYIIGKSHGLVDIVGNYYYCIIIPEFQKLLLDMLWRDRIKCGCRLIAQDYLRFDLLDLLRGTASAAGRWKVNGRRVQAVFDLVPQTRIFRYFSTISSSSFLSGFPCSWPICYIIIYRHWKRFGLCGKESHFASYVRNINTSVRTSIPLRLFYSLKPLPRL